MLAKFSKKCHKITANAGVGSTAHLPDQSRQRRAIMANCVHEVANENLQQSTNEIWKSVPSLKGVLASNMGRLLLPPRHAPMHHGGFRLYETRPTTGAVTRAKKGARHTYRGLYCKFFGNIKVHQAVCEAFHGPKPFPKAVVIHLDENALNNRPENLKWGTQKENLNMPKFKAYLRSPERVRKIMDGKSKAKKARQDQAA